MHKYIHIYKYSSGFGYLLALICDFLIPTHFQSNMMNCRYFLPPYLLLYKHTLFFPIVFIFYIFVFANKKITQVFFLFFQKDNGCLFFYYPVGRIHDKWLFCVCLYVCVKKKTWTLQKQKFPNYKSFNSMNWMMNIIKSVIS